MKKFLIIFYSFLFIGVFKADNFAQNTNNNGLILAGFRASRILTSYPDSTFPNEDYWTHVGNSMSDKLNSSTPSSLWLVSIYQGNGITRMGFPVQDDPSSKILGFGYDTNEEYLTRFDKEGFKVYLQLEPGSANIDILIDMVFKRYGHHSCVVGLGIDIEWYEADKYSDGRKVSDSAAISWEVKVKSYNENYNLFLIHFRTEWMPPTYRGDIIFINDGQQYASFNDMKTNFIEWANYFSNNKVGYHYGFPADEFWWSTINDPAKTIGQELISSIPNLYSLYWVDFSITKIFPITVTDIIAQNTMPSNFFLMQNYPNPFNPSTVISYQISEISKVSLVIYDILGKEVATLLNEEKNVGIYNVNFTAKSLTSGVYLYRLLVVSKSGIFTQTKKMMLTK